MKKEQPYTTKKQELLINYLDALSNKDTKAQEEIEKQIAKQDFINLIVPPAISACLIFSGISAIFCTNSYILGGAAICAGIFVGHCDFAKLER